MMNLLTVGAGFVEEYVLEIAIIILVFLYVVQLINAKRLRGLLSRR